MSTTQSRPRGALGAGMPQDTDAAVSKKQMANPLTTKEAAARLGLAEHTLAVWRIYGKGPRFIKAGRAVRYDPAEVERFKAENSWQSTSEFSASAALVRR